MSEPNHLSWTLCLSPLLARAIEIAARRNGRAVVEEALQRLGDSFLMEFIAVEDPATHCRQATPAPLPLASRDESAGGGSAPPPAPMIITDVELRARLKADKQEIISKRADDFRGTGTAPLPAIQLTRKEALRRAEEIVLEAVYADYASGKLGDRGDADRHLETARARSQDLIEQEADRLMHPAPPLRCEQCGEIATTTLGGRHYCETHAVAAPRAAPPAMKAA